MSEVHTNNKRQPLWYIPHGGGPCFFMDWNPADTWHGMADFLKNIASTLEQRPRAIVLVSAHWLESVFTVGSHPQPELIYDYYGFPAHTYELTYPAMGEPNLAEQIVSTLSEQGVQARANPVRGYDHGVFIPLKLVFPKADIPVLQLSLRTDLSPQAHLEMGKALSALRDDNVLIIGSGMSFHNMRAYGDPRFSALSDEFDDWLTTAVESPQAEREQLLAKWTEAPHARQCHPLNGEEHLLPLMVVAGAAGDSVGEKIYSERVMETRISAFRFI